MFVLLLILKITLDALSVEASSKQSLVVFAAGSRESSIIILRG